jgi:hypothetical protein
MQPPQSFNQPPNIFQLDAQPLDRFLLYIFVAVQEALNQFAVHKTRRFVLFSDLIFERAVLCEFHIPRRSDQVSEIGLQGNEEVEVIL